MASTGLIEIDYEPRNWAQSLHDAITRWIILVLHRRAGKTTAAFNHLQRDAMRYEKTRYAYIAPLHVQAKRIVWAMAKHYSKDIPGIDYNEAELLIKYPNGSEIMVLGANNPDSLRGIGLWGCFLDEYPQMSPIIFTEIITKCLADHQGYCIFGGTPKGRGHFFRIFEVAKSTPQEWTVVHKTIDESLKEESGEVIDNLRQSLADDKRLVQNGLMTEDEFMQEWYNSFEAAIKGAVYLKQIAKARSDGRIGLFKHNASLPVYTVWDLGISDAMAIGFYQRQNGKVFKIDYYENTGHGLAHYIKVVKEKPYIYGKHFGPHDLKKREVATGKSVLDSAKKLGLEFELVPSISLKQGLDLARAFWSRLHIDKAGCELWLDLIGMYKYEYDEDRRMYSPKPVHDFSSHAADELRYAAIVEDDMVMDDEVDIPPPRIENPDDDYMGTEDPYGDKRDGFGKHPMMKDVDIGRMGHG